MSKHHTHDQGNKKVNATCNAEIARIQPNIIHIILKKFSNQPVKELQSAPL